MKNTLSAMFLLPLIAVSGCASMLVPAPQSTCTAHENGRLCVVVDPIHNVTTRTLERSGKLFVSTCNNITCSDFTEIK